MNMILPFVICAALSVPAIAQQREAMKHSNPRAESAAQANVDARPKLPIKRAVQPEAMRSTNAKAVAEAERRKAERLHSGKKPADRIRMRMDAEKL